MLVRTFAPLVGVFVLLLPLLAMTARFSSGASPGFDGYDGSNCAVCHRTPDGDPNVNVGTGAVTIASADRYVAGQPFEITISVTNTTEPASAGSRRQGFQVGVRDASGTPVGTFDLRGSSLVQFAGGDPAFVTHTSDGNQQSTWTFDWIPPADMPPEAVTLYAAGNAANGNASLTGDFIYTAEKPLALATATEPGVDEEAILLGPVSPQPVQSMARASLSLREPGMVRARLVDGLGRTVRDLAGGEFPAGESVLEVSARGLSAGVYFLVVEAPQGRRTARVVIAR